MRKVGVVGSKGPLDLVIFASDVGGWGPFLGPYFSTAPNI